MSVRLDICAIYLNVATIMCVYLNLSQCFQLIPPTLHYTSRDSTCGGGAHCFWWCLLRNRALHVSHSTGCTYLWATRNAQQEQHPFAFASSSLSLWGTCKFIFGLLYVLGNHAQCLLFIRRLRKIRKGINCVRLMMRIGSEVGRLSAI